MGYSRSLTARPRLVHDLYLRRYRDGVLAVSSECQHVLGINQVAVSILKLCDGRRDVAEIARVTADHRRSEIDACDVAAFVVELADLGWIDLRPAGEVKGER